jgi:hypothetical protein
MVRVHSGLPVISLNLLGKQLRLRRGFGQLVTIGHQSRQIFYRFALMLGKRNRIDLEGRG